MYFNPDKSVYMHITHKHNPVLYNYIIDNTAIKKVFSIKYFGIKIKWHNIVHALT